MKMSLRRWLAPPVLPGDEEGSRRVRVLNAANLAIVVFVMLVIGAVIAAENARLLRHPNSAVTATQWATYTVLFATAGALLYFSLNSAVEALARSRREVDERKRAERQLRKLLRAVEQSPSSIVITDLGGTIEYVNPRFTQVTGYSFDEAVGKNPRILKTGETPPETHRELWETLTANKEWRGMFVNRKKDGSTYFESATISAITDENGKATHYLAVKEDITEQKRAEDALRDSEARFRSLFEQTHDAVFILDLEGRHVMTNQRAIELLGYDSTEIGSISVDQTSVEIEQSRDVIRRLIAGETIPLYERRFKRKNGEVFTAEVNVELVRDKNGNPVHIQSVMRDITHRKRVEEALKAANDELSLRLIEVEHLHGELRQQALHDPLTGLHNRRYLTETLPREIARVNREQDALSVIVADLDHFKEINDANGHRAGDEFLVEVARILKGSTRGADLVCRYGGEEFVLVLPGTTIHAAERRAEEIRRRCERTIIRHEGRDLTTTMSLGVATYPEHTMSPDGLIALADKAMYESKRAGRNRVTVWTNPSCIVA